MTFSGIIKEKNLGSMVIGIYGFAFQETLPGAPLLRHLLKQLLVFAGEQNF